MGAFHSTFSTIGKGDDFSPAAWQEFFEPAALPMWENDEGGSIQFRNDDGDTYGLTMMYNPGDGVAMSYDRYNSEDGDGNVAYFAQGDTPIGPGYVFLESDVPCPENSFLPLDLVWQVVSQFLANPEQMPQAVTWVDSESDQLESMEDYI